MRSLAIAIAIVLLPPVASAGRPFTTEDAGVLARGGCELETFAARGRSRPDPAERGGWVQAGCGTGWRTQLALAVGRFKSGDELQTTVRLIGKTALRPLSDESLGVTLAYALEGADPAGGPLRASGTSASLVVSVPYGRLLAHANVGANRDRTEDKTAGTYALAVERSGERGLDFGFEVFGEASAPPWIGTGARYAIRADKLFIDFSYAVQTGGGSARQATVGLKYAFP